MKKKINIKRILALVLTLAMVLGTVPMQATANAMEVTFASFDSVYGDGMPLGDYTVAFALGDFPDTYQADEGDSLVFIQYVTITSGLISDGAFMPPASTPTDLLPEGEDEPEDGEYENGYENGAYEPIEPTDPDPTDGLENSVALVWYLDGERRTDKGTFSTSANFNWLPGDIIPMELRFDEVTAADMGVWTLRAYSYGQWVESPYALFLQVGEFEPLAGIVATTDGTVVIGVAGVTDTVALIQAAIAAELAAGRDVTVTGTFTDANATLSINILAGRTVTWNASISGDINATIISITGSGTFVVEGGAIANTHTAAGSWNAQAIHTIPASAATIIINGGTISTARGGGVPAVFIQSSLAGTALVITGGTFSAGSEVVIQINTNSTLYLSGGNVTPAGGIRTMGGTAFYTGDNTARFGTAGGVALFTPGINLFRLDNVVLSHTFDPITPADGTVTATFLAEFNITDVTANPATATHSFAGNVVTFGGAFNHNNITLTVSGTLPNGNLTVPAFTTAPFGVNTGGSAMHTVTFNLNGGTRTGGGELVQQIVDGANAFPPTASLAGHIFDGWDGGLYTNITSGRTLTARWTPLPGLQINGVGNHTTLAAFQSAINDALAPNNAVVNVTGGLVLADTTLAIDILAGRTVNWNANYSGTVGAGQLINITGGGAFNLTGGTVEQLGGAAAVFAGGDIRFTMSGGNIYSDSANMNAFVATGNSDILITGGRIELRNNNPASILQATGNSIVRITGGVTLARVGAGNAIGAMLTSTVVITGNTSLPGGLNPTANGLIIQHPGTGSYGIGEAVATATFNTLATNPNAATAVWALHDGRSGMTYTTTTATPRTRFVEIPGVTLIPTFAITINGGGTGYSASSNPAPAGATVTLNPGTAPAGRIFSHWTISGATLLPNGTSFVMPGNPVTVTANWAFYWVIEYSANNTAWGSVTAAGLDANGRSTAAAGLPSTFTLTAEPAPGYRFVRFDNNDNNLPTSTNNPLTVNNDGGVFFTPPGGTVMFNAVFERITHNVTINQPTGGTIAITNNGGGTEAALGITGVPQGNEITLTANPTAATHILGTWTVSGTTAYSVNGATLTLTVDTAGITVSHTFAAINRAISHNVTSNAHTFPAATVTAEGATATPPTALNVTITNEGNISTGALQYIITPIGTTPANAFVISGGFPTGGIAFNDNDTFTVQPAANLGVGTHSATIEISSGTGVTPAITAQSFTVTFVVSYLATAITTTTLPQGVANENYGAATLQATGVSPITWSLASGNLPTGLTLNADGTITGTPTAAGTFNFTVQANGLGGTDTQALSIIIHSARVPVSITTATLPSATVGVLFSQQLTTAGTGIITWSSTNLPAWLTLTPQGLLFGTPSASDITASTNFDVTATATGAAAHLTEYTDTAQLSITVAQPIPTVSVGTQAGTLTQGTAGSVTFTVTTANIANGTAITLNNAPTGVTLATTATTGNSTIITINTTAATQQGAHPLTVTIGGVTSNNFNLVVGAAHGSGGTDSGNDSGSGGNDSDTWTPTTQTTTTRAVTVNGVNVTIRVQNNVATIDLPQATVTQLINATTGGNFNNTVVFNLSNINGVTITSAVIPTTALRQFATAGEDGLSVEIRLPQGTVNLDSAAGISAANQAGANLQISLNQVNHNQVPAGQRGEIRSGDVVFRIAVSSGTNAIRNFDGTITITLPFTGTFPVAVWHLDNNGNLHRMESTYNRTARTVTFTTNHLSLFVVGHDDGTRNEVAAGDTDEGITDIPPGGWPNANYNPLTGRGWENPFVDVSENDWFFDSVRFAHMNNLFAGTSADTFSPNSPMTRVMMVTVLYRMAGEPSTSGIPNNFTDVTDGAWYDNAIIWAAANGIVSGIGNSQFAPNNNITREQMAVILNNFARHMDLDLPTIRTGTFVDEAEISAWAHEYVNALFEAGVISGVGNNHFNPRGQGTRAEVATMLRNFMEAVQFGPFAAVTDDFAMLRDEDLYYDRRDEDELEQEPEDADGE